MFKHQILFRSNYSYLEMTNKPVPVGIARTRSHFDGESPHRLDMGMGMGNLRFFYWVWGWGWGCE